jgi:hypothetical protein
MYQILVGNLADDPNKQTESNRKQAEDDVRFAGSLNSVMTSDKHK